MRLAMSIYLNLNLNLRFFYHAAMKYKTRAGTAVEKLQKIISNQFLCCFSNKLSDVCLLDKLSIFDRYSEITKERKRDSQCADSSIKVNWSFRSVHNVACRFRSSSLIIVQPNQLIVLMNCPPWVGAVNSWIVWGFSAADCWFHNTSFGGRLGRWKVPVGVTQSDENIS